MNMQSEVCLRRTVSVLTLIGLCWACQAQGAEDVLWSKGPITVFSRTLDERTQQRTDGDPDSRYIEVQRNGRTVFGSRNGYLPKSVAVLWKRQDSEKGPDVIIGAHTGGSGCCYDVFTFTFANEPPVEVSQFMHTDAVKVTEVDGVPHVTSTSPTR